MVISLINPEPGDRIIDPACGSGGFLISALDHVRERLRQEALEKAWTPELLVRREVQVATDCFRGLDKDEFLSRTTKAYMALVGDGRGGVFCENSLGLPTDWSSGTRAKIKLGSFDVVVTNPPFGSKIAVKGHELLSQYQLARKWKPSAGRLTPTAEVVNQRPPQILFIERCLDLLKAGGRLGIVLPESMVSNPSHRFVIEYIRSRATINAVIALPEALFKTSGKGGTHTKVAVLIVTNQPEPDDYDIYMSEVRWCGHDSRGNPTLRLNRETREYELLDEVPLVKQKIRALYDRAIDADVDHKDRLAFRVSKSDIKDNIYVPKYYDHNWKAI